MENRLIDNKHTWVIKKFSSLPLGPVYSDIFISGGCVWRLAANNYGDFKLYLQVTHSLPKRKTARCLLTIINQDSKTNKEAQKPFELEPVELVSSVVIPLTTLKPKDDGFLVNDELKIVAEIDVSEDDEETARPVKKMKLENGSVTSSSLTTETSSVGKETVDVNGFQVLPSQVELVRRIFEKHPDIAVGFRSKNSLLRKACMNSLLCLIETLCQSPQDLSNEDLVEADNALAYVKDAGFKVDWLWKKLYQVKEKKKEEQTSEIQLRELEEELKYFKRKCSDVEALVENEKAKVGSARASLTLDDIMT